MKALLITINDYYFAGDIKNEAAYNERANKFIEAGFDVTPWSDDLKSYANMVEPQQIISESSALGLLTQGIDFGVLKSIDVTPTDAAAKIDHLLKGFERLQNKYDDLLASASEANFNKRTNTHDGSVALTEFNETLLCEDYCTDQLQAELNNGWRIIAVCVQPNQRRPDYILGRHNPKEY